MSKKVQFALFSPQADSRGISSRSGRIDAKSSATIPFGLSIICGRAGCPTSTIMNACADGGAVGKD